jgi:hypothetical protein
MPLGVTLSRSVSTRWFTWASVSVPLGRADTHLAHGTWYWACARDNATVLRTVRALVERKDAY